MEAAGNSQFTKMTQKPVASLVLSLAVPTIISMLVTAVYNTADTFFVSQIGTSASAAVGIVFSVMAIIQAVGFTLGMGCGSLISRMLGAKDSASASMYGSTSFFTSLVLGSLLAAAGILCIEPLVYLLGATETIYPYAKDYITYILLGAPLMCGSYVMNNILRSEGKAAFSMIGLTAGGFINIALDPLFIFTFNLGTKGAAIATLISQSISFSILLSFFLRKKSIVRLSIRFVSKIVRDYYDIIKTGLPSFIRQGLASAAAVFLNISASAFGDASVAAVSIVARIIMFVSAIMIGLGQGFVPVSGYNYGAMLYSRVKRAFFFTVMCGTVFLSVSAVLIFIAAPLILSVFRNDPEVISLGTSVLRFQCLALPLHAFVIASNMLMQSTGQAWKATFLSSTRQGLFFIPLILILPVFFGIEGLKTAQLFADLAAFMTALPFLVFFLKKMNS
ncbi:MAG TPA: MATE family efflux transporter [Treponemataceae bacterium]|nr:MATE family efflux transporter [Treponemataceae bacterium]